MSKQTSWLCFAGTAGPEFERYDSKRDAIEAFRTAAEDLARFGQTIEATLHYAPLKRMIQEYPDFVLSLGPRGGVKCERC
jgi:hypothetical protein